VNSSRPDVLIGANFFPPKERKLIPMGRNLFKIIIEFFSRKDMNVIAMSLFSNEDARRFAIRILPLRFSSQSA